MMVRFVAAAALTLLPAAAVPAHASASPTPTDDGDPALAAVVAAVADTTYSPGIAVAVVRRDGAMWAKDFGMADREAGRRVGPKTRFYIASTTKALTGLAALQRAARGELDLDAPLSRALPGVRLGTGLAADSIRVRDLLTHTHGIDFMSPISLKVAFIGGATNAEMIAALATHGPAKTGRAFRYSNLGYDLAGIVLAPDRTQGWKEVVEREVLVPAGMTATTAYRSRVPDSELAWPYVMGPDGWERQTAGKQDATMGPAGGHFSTALDLARLVTLELNQGRFDGRPSVAATAIALSQTLQAVQDRTIGPYHRHGWGIGWDLATYESDTLLQRFGNYSGYFSHVSFMPSRGAGVVVLANGGDLGFDVANAIATVVYDHLAGRADAAERLAKRRADLAAKLAETRKAVAEDRAKRAARVGPLPLPLAAYAGRYVHPFLGALEISARKDRLHAHLGAAESDVEIYDAAKNQLRVELFGGGSVLEAIVPEGATHPGEMRMMGQSFARQ